MRHAVSVDGCCETWAVPGWLVGWLVGYETASIINEGNRRVIVQLETLHEIARRWSGGAGEEG